MPTTRWWLKVQERVTDRKRYASRRHALQERVTVTLESLPCFPLRPESPHPLPSPSDSDIHHTFSHGQSICLQTRAERSRCAQQRAVREDVCYHFNRYPLDGDSSEDSYADPGCEGHFHGREGQS